MTAALRPARGISLRSACTLLGLVAVIVAGGCAAKKDTSYLHSRESEPLVIPQGLDTPVYSDAMSIPAPAAAGVEEGVDLESPPRRIPQAE